jgi:hypothetical protein
MDVDVDVDVDVDAAATGCRPAPQIIATATSGGDPWPA